MFSCLVSIHSKMWIQKQISCVHQRLVSLAWLRCNGLICSTNIRLYTLGVWTTCVKYPPLAGHFLVNAVGEGLAVPIQSLSQDNEFHNLTAAKWKKHCRLGDHAYFFFFFLFFDMKPGSYQPIGGIIIASKSLSSAKAAFVCSFRGSGKNCRHLGCRSIIRSRGSAVQNKGITVNRMVCCSQFSNDIYAVISLYQESTCLYIFYDIDFMSGLFVYSFFVLK